jgi:hypothetical protein
MPDAGLVHVAAARLDEWVPISKLQPKARLGR